MSSGKEPECLLAPRPSDGLPGLRWFSSRCWVSDTQWLFLNRWVKVLRSLPAVLVLPFSQGKVDSVYHLSICCQLLPVGKQGMEQSWGKAACRSLSLRSGCCPWRGEMPQSLWLGVLIQSPGWALRARLWVNNWLLLIPASTGCCVGHTSLLEAEVGMPSLVPSGELLSLARVHPLGILAFCSGMSLVLAQNSLASPLGWNGWGSIKFFFWEECVGFFVDSFFFIWGDC